MEKYSTVVPKELTFISIIPDIDDESFMVNIQGYNSFSIHFMEIESFIGEYDDKLEKYLKKFKTIKEKVYEAIDIGYDFEDMIIDYVKNLVEYELIILRPKM